MAVPAQKPGGTGLRLGQNRNQPGAVRQAQGCHGQTHGRNVDRVGHHRMGNAQRAAPARCRAEHDNFMPRQFHARRSGRAGGKGRKVATDHVIIHGLPCNFPQRDPDAEGRSRTRQAHGFQRIPRRRGRPPCLRFGNALQRQQRAFDLDEVDIARVQDSRILHRRAHATGDHFDLSGSPQCFEYQVRGSRLANGQCSAFFPAVGVPHLEHQEMRGQRAFGPAGHDDADLLGQIMRHRGQQSVFQHQAGKAARKIIDAAVAFGFAQNGDDIFSPDVAARHHRRQSGDVIRAAGRDAVDVGLAHYGNAPMKLAQSLSAPNTPPCIFTILMAARWLP